MKKMYSQLALSKEREERRVETGHWARFFAVATILSLMAQMGLLTLFYCNSKNTLFEHSEQINTLSTEVHRLQEFISNQLTEMINVERSSRWSRETRYPPEDEEDYQNDEESSPLVVEAKYSEAQTNGTYKGKEKTEGLRIYRSWFKNGKRRRSKGRSRESPIKKHHRISAVWSENETNNNLNAHFAGKHQSLMHRKSYSRPKSSHDSSQNSNQSPNESSKTKERQLRRANKPNRGFGEDENFIGMKSVHFIGVSHSNPRGKNSRMPNENGLYTNWQLSQWSSRIRAGDSFPLKNGTVRVSSPGVYYVYAQINYLDENDINAFKIYKNDDPLFLCTTMTKTPTPSAKANTCFTAGAVYLEQGDSIFIQDLEPGRGSVLLPAHSFFGLIQVSKMGI